ncbi:MAG: hypothetical protein WAT74_16960, partial [Flavobacteriales bacterium]
MASISNTANGSIVRRVLLFSALLIAASAHAQHDCSSTKHAAHSIARGGGGLWPWDITHQRITLDLTLGNVISGRCDIDA